MATQAIVSIVSGGDVLMKIVTGSDGYNADRVAADIRDAWPCTAERAYEIASKYFCSSESLVIITKDEIFCECSDDIDERYRNTFTQPEFNPRWESGACAYVLIVRI